MKLGLYTSPEYLAARGTIRDIADLTAHDAIILRGPANRLRPWSLQDGAVVREMVPTPVLILADGQALVEASILGLGIAQILDRVARPHVEAGRLVHILPGADVPGPPVNAIIPLGQKIPSKVRVVLNYLVDQLRNN